MKEPHWVPEAAVRAIHDELIAEHGGKSGILNAGQLLSTLAKPQNLFNYSSDPSLFDLAAAYGYGLIKNHCFVDGNKRVTVAIIGVFLRLNNYKLIAPETDVVIYICRLAASLKTPEEDQADLAKWIQANSILFYVHR